MARSKNYLTISKTDCEGTISNKIYNYYIRFRKLPEPDEVVYTTTEHLYRNQRYFNSVLNDYKDALTAMRLAEQKDLQTA